MFPVEQSAVQEVGRRVNLVREIESREYQ